MDKVCLDEFDIKKYVKDRLSEIKEEDEYVFAKSVLYDGLYRMSEVFEERYKSLYKRYMMSLREKRRAMRLRYFYFQKMRIHF